MVRLAALLFERTLDFFTSSQSLRSPTSGCFEPGKPDLGIGVYEDDRVAQSIPPGLVEDCRVENDGGDVPFTGLSRDGLLEGSSHDRMENRFEISESLGTRKNNRPERPAVNRSTDAEISKRLENLLAKPLQNSVAARVLFEEDMADLVRVEQKSPEFGEFGCGKALTRTNPADQSNHGDRTIPPGTGRSTRTGFFRGEARHDDSIHAR